MTQIKYTMPYNEGKKTKVRHRVAHDLFVDMIHDDLFVRFKNGEVWTHIPMMKKSSMADIKAKYFIIEQTFVKCGDETWEIIEYDRPNTHYTNVAAYSSQRSFLND